MSTMRKERDSLGEIEVPADKLWGAQTQRSIEYFRGSDLIPREMIAAYAILKKASAKANRDGKRLSDEAHRLIAKAYLGRSCRPTARDSKESADRTSDCVTRPVHNS